MIRSALGPLRNRLLPLVAFASVVMALAAPLAYWVRERSELIQDAQGNARRAADEVLSEIARDRPRLWTYDRAKIRERLATEGLLRAAAVVIRDGRGRLFSVVGSPAERAIWGSAPVIVGGEEVARVWSGADPRPAEQGTVLLAGVFALIAAAVAFPLWLLPSRAIRSAETRIRELVGRLGLTLQEEERRRIASDLHDGVGQALTAARLHVLALKRAGGSADVCDVVGQRLDEAIDEVRRATSALMPPVVAELGLATALRRHCEAFATASGLEIACDAPADLPRASADVETACYRIVQEALTNTARHAHAHHAWVRLSAEGGELVLQVRDDGAGLPGAQEGQEGFGLRSIRHRADLLGGKVTFSGAAGAAIAVRFPLTEATR